MNLPDFIRRRAGAIALVLNGLLSLGITVSGLVYYNSRPHPAPQARLGSVTIDLRQLDHRLTFRDLQSAGMFADLECDHCDFSGRLKKPYLVENDFTDIDFMATLFLARGRHVLSLDFYGRDIPAGQRRLEQALQELRSRFPGHAQAIRQVAGGWEDSPSPAPDPLASAGLSARDMGPGAVH